MKHFMHGVLLKNIYFVHDFLLNYIVNYSLHVSTILRKTEKRILKNYPPTENFYPTFLLGRFAMSMDSYKYWFFFLIQASKIGMQIT